MASNAPDLIISVRKKCPVCDWDKVRVSAADRYITMDGLQRMYNHLVDLFSDHEHDCEISSKIYPGHVLEEYDEEQNQ